MKPAVSILSCALWLLTAGCQATTAAGRMGPDYTLVLIKTGTRTAPLAKEEATEVFGGHFTNMERLAQEGHLLVAGPYGPGRSDTSLRGLFILDTGDRAQAVALAESDPGFKAHVFRFEYRSLTTDADLRAHLASELATREAAAKAGRKPAPGEGGRSFVWLTVPDGDGLHEALARLQGVLMLARLDGQATFALLDAENLDAARVLLGPVAGRLGSHQLDPWFGSGALVHLAVPHR